MWAVARNPLADRATVFVFQDGTHKNERWRKMSDQGKSCNGVWFYILDTYSHLNLWKKHFNFVFRLQECVVPRIAVNRSISFNTFHPLLTSKSNNPRDYKEA
ncbi:hypothetical protein DdX_09806 [Ditylenchus destructor]|uniref:Uncharacterized protein n=1 Tax=Ditylenchus destructor TaxID=166010 RepID=A0AAD4N3B9_9BILA|nr:hypothetical protein DdX_09806 [Ditylenchus destructor]